MTDSSIVAQYVEGTQTVIFASYFIKERGTVVNEGGIRGYKCALILVSTYNNTNISQPLIFYFNIHALLKYVRALILGIYCIYVSTVG